MEAEPELVLTDAPDGRAEEIIDAGLAEYNRQQAGYVDSPPLAVLARDPASGTIHFQAPGFHARHGWREMARIECDPPGHARICVSKRLVPAVA